MLTKQEIIDLSKEFSLTPNIVEKDYVLAWVLAGIANHPELLNTWIFKGGTCLKKCYFETFRFSEDLDFTLIDTNHLDEKFLIECFTQIVHWIYQTTGIEIPLNTIRFELYSNGNGKTSVEGRVGYIGPLQRRGDPVRIKFDLTADEILVLPPTLREVHHPYSDKPQDGIKVNCYSFLEVFAEKIRALSERARPRDLYDVIHLYRHALSDIKLTSIFEVLKKKCDFKKIHVPTIKHIENHPKRQELETEWENMLGHQLPVLPPFDNFWEELPNLFDWLHSTASKVQLNTAPLPQEKFDRSWKPSNMIQAWCTSIPMELIRYAGANHLCIELWYENKNRLIEPYDLKRTQDGKLLLIAIKHDSGEWRSYRVDRIQRIEVTQVSFVPRYLVSLSSFSI